MKKPKTSRSDRKALAADLVVGANVRRLRIKSGLTLAELANALGVSHQQLQKYETGANRISAGMLYEVARFFVLPVDAMFEGAEGAKDDDAAAARVRRRCQAVLDRTSSMETLEAFERVLRAMSGR